MSNAHIEVVRVGDGIHLVGRWIDVVTPEGEPRAVLIENVHAHDDGSVVFKLSVVSEGSRLNRFLGAPEDSLVGLSSEATIAQAKGRYLDAVDTAEAAFDVIRQGIVRRQKMWFVTIGFLIVWLSGVIVATISGADMRGPWLMALPLVLFSIMMNAKSARRDGRTMAGLHNPDTGALVVIRENRADIAANRPIALRNGENVVHGREGQPFAR